MLGMFFDRTLTIGILIAVFTTALSVPILVFGLQGVGELRHEAQLAAIFPTPRTIVFKETGESARLKVRGIYSDGEEAALSDDEADIIFSSSDTDVVTVDSDGVVTAIQPGSADITVRYGNISAEAPVIVYSPIVEIPPIDPDKVFEFDDGSGVVLNRIIVTPIGSKYDRALADEIAAEHGGIIIAEFTNLVAFVLEFDISSAEELAAMLEQLDSDHRVESVLPNLLFTLSQSPDQSPIPTASSVTNDTLELAKRDAGAARAYTSIGVEGAWHILTQMDALAKPVHIAVIDDALYLPCNVPIPGFDTTVLCNELGTANLIDNTHFPSNATDVQRMLFSDHGILVSSVIIAANAPNKENGNFSGVVTSASNVSYTLHFYPAYNNTNVVKMDYSKILGALDNMKPVEDQIDVANMSFSGRSCAGITLIRNIFLITTCEFDDRFEAMPHIVFVPAAGNQSVDASNRGPADFSHLDNIITVGGLNDSNTDRWVGSIESSNYGNKITVAAQGEKVRVAAVYVDTKTQEAFSFYDLYSGTSLSAPIVSGVVALMRSVNPDLTPKEIKEILRATANDVTVNTPVGQEVWKHVQADAAIDEVLSRSVHAEIPDNPGFRASESFQWVQYSFPVANTGDMTWKYYVEAEASSPNADKREPQKTSIVLAPDQSVTLEGAFYPDTPGDWTITVKVCKYSGCMNPVGIRSHLDTPILAQPETPLVELSNRITVTGSDSGSSQVVSQPVVPSTPGGVLDADANILLVADTSGSMADDGKIENLRDAVIEFIDRVKIEDTGEYVGLIDFDDHIETKIDLAQLAYNEAEWPNAVQRLDADGGTAFYDAVAEAVDILERKAVQGQDRVNIVIALTDGLDSGNGRTLAQLISEIQNSSVPVLLFVLGFGSDADLDSLEELADSTGGVALPATPDDIDRLYKLLTTVF